MKQLKLIIAALMFISPFAASADPINYTMTYDGTIGPDGVGSFTFDENTSLLSGLNWLFDDGTSGSYNDAIDQFLGSNVLLGNCPGCGATRSGLTVSGDFVSVGWEGDGDYTFRISDTIIYTGVFSVAVASVPEPGTLTLLGLGLAGMGMTRRRKKI